MSADPLVKRTSNSEFRPLSVAHPRERRAPQSSHHRNCTTMNSTPLHLTEDFFCGLERARTRALVEKDMALAMTMHAADYMLISPSGSTFTRERYLGLIASGVMNYRLWEIGDLRIRMTRTMTLVRYEATIAFGSLDNPGEPFRVWHTDSYELIGESWQAVWSQATKII